MSTRALQALLLCWESCHCEEPGLLALRMGGAVEEDAARGQRQLTGNTVCTARGPCLSNSGTRNRQDNSRAAQPRPVQWLTHRMVSRV